MFNGQLIVVIEHVNVRGKQDPALWWSQVL